MTFYPIKFQLRKEVLKAGFLVALFSLTGCLENTATENRSLTVLYTNDEHGWMEGVEESLGAANLYALWQEQEGYTKDGPFLLLSGGDNWTGPAISTWVEGESMVDLMNTMDYDASAIGNHEFDFGLEALESRANEANYPYLSANIKWRETGDDLSAMGVLPFTLKDVAGIKVGIIGLTTLDTPTTTSPVNVKDFEFIDYQQAVRDTVEQLNQAQPDLLFIISHVCMSELSQLADQLQDLNINLMGAGHCNELVAQQQGGAVMLGGGSRFKTYAKASFTLNSSGAVEALEFSTHSNTPVDDEIEISGLIDKWREVSAEALAANLGFNGADLSQSDAGLKQAIIDSWSIQYPIADIAITNAGGLREGLPAGEITFGDVFNIMPFDNTIIGADVPGGIIKEVLAAGTRPVVAGLQQSAEGLVLSKTGELLQDDKIYSLLINSFMYEGGDNYGAIAEYDPNGVNTDMSYRQPFVIWLEAQATSSTNPLQI